MDPLKASQIGDKNHLYASQNASQLRTQVPVGTSPTSSTSIHNRAALGVSLPEQPENTRLKLQCIHQSASFASLNYNLQESIGREAMIERRDRFIQKLEDVTADIEQNKKDLGHSESVKNAKHLALQKLSQSYEATIAAFQGQLLKANTEEIIADRCQECAILFVIQMALLGLDQSKIDQSQCAFLTKDNTEFLQTVDQSQAVELAQPSCATILFLLENQDAIENALEADGTLVKLCTIVATTRNYQLSRNLGALLGSDDKKKMFKICMKKLKEEYDQKVKIAVNKMEKIDGQLWEQPPIQSTVITIDPENPDLDVLGAATESSHSITNTYNKTNLRSLLEVHDKSKKGQTLWHLLREAQQQIYIDVMRKMSFIVQTEAGEKEVSRERIYDEFQKEWCSLKDEDKEKFVVNMLNYPYEIKERLLPIAQHHGKPESVISTQDMSGIPPRVFRGSSMDLDKIKRGIEAIEDIIMNSSLDPDDKRSHLKSNQVFQNFAYKKIDEALNTYLDLESDQHRFASPMLIFYQFMHQGLSADFIRMVGDCESKPYKDYILEQCKEEDLLSYMNPDVFTIFNLTGAVTGKFYHDQQGNYCYEGTALVDRTKLYSVVEFGQFNHPERTTPLKSLLEEKTRTDIISVEAEKKEHPPKQIQAIAALKITLNKDLVKAATEAIEPSTAETKWKKVFDQASASMTYTIKPEDEAHANGASLGKLV